MRLNDCIDETSSIHFFAVYSRIRMLSTLGEHQAAIDGISAARTKGKLTDEDLRDLCDAAGNVYLALGDLDKAKEEFSSFYRMLDRDEGNSIRGKALGNLGLVNLDMRNYDEAVKWFERSLEVVSESASRLFEMVTLGNLAETYHRKGESERGVELCQQSFEMNTELDYKRHEGHVHRTHGKCMRDLGMLDYSLECFTKARKLFSDLQNEVEIVWTDIDIGQSFLHLAEPMKYGFGLRRKGEILKDAKTRLHGALDKMHEHGVPDNFSLTANLAWCYDAMRVNDEAETWANKSLEIAKEYSIQDMPSNYPERQMFTRVEKILKAQSVKT